MNDTLLRTLTMMRLIPRFPKGIGTAELQARLAAGGFDISLRSIQRDLVELSAVLPLINSETKPSAWSWHPDAEAFSLPALDPQTALTFKVAEAHLGSLLPTTTLAFLAPWFAAAAGALEACGNELAAWPEKIRVVPSGPRQIPPTIDPKVHSVIYDALLQERMVDVRYLSFEATVAKSYAVHPIAIVVRDRQVTLVCTVKNFGDVRHLLLHRIQSACLLDAVASRPANFNLDQHIASGEFSLPLDAGMIAFEADFYGHAARSVTESPLTEEQTSEVIEEGWIRVKANVINSLALRGWLHSFGDEVVVINPPELQSAFAEIVRSLCDFYKGEQ